MIQVNDQIHKGQALLFVALDDAWCIAPHVRNAQPAGGRRSSFAPGKVQFTCDEDYEFENEKSTGECAGGTWTDLPVCKRKCPHCKHDQNIRTS